MKNRFIVSISALALAAAVTLPAFAAETTTNATAGAAATAGVKAPGADATVTASTEASGSFTVQNVAPETPFGAITFDPKKTPDELATTLTADQQKELGQRCQVVSDNQTVYNQDTSVWCTTYLDWWKKNHPAG